MPCKVAKQHSKGSARSTQNYKAAVIIINIIGILVMPYSFYKEKHLLYKIAIGYKKYKEYIYYSHSYNSSSISLAAGLFFLSSSLVP